MILILFLSIILKHRVMLLFFLYFFLFYKSFFIYQTSYEGCMNVNHFYFIFYKYQVQENKVLHFYLSSVNTTSVHSVDGIDDPQYNRLEGVPLSQE